VTLLVYALYRPRDLIVPRRWMTLFGLGLVFGAPVILRQVQMAAVLGVDFWLRDLIYSAAIKVSVLSRVVPVPSIEDLDAIYRAAAVLRARAAPTSSVAVILQTFVSLVTYALIPSIGLMTFGLAVVVGMLAIVTAVRLARLRPRVFLAGLHARGIRGRARQHLVGSVILLAAVVGGTVVGLAIFAPLSFQIYVKHENPLLAAPIAMIKGLIFAALLGAVVSWRGARRVAAGIAMLVLVVDHLVVQVDNVRTIEAMDVSWIPAVMERRDATFAVSFTPNSVSVFTDNSAVGITAGLERVVSARIAASQPPFVMSDFFMFGEGDAANRDLYTRPDFWLYYPTDRRVPYDNPIPSCRTDYLTGLLRQAGAP